jgi:hypothetical protein
VTETRVPLTKRQLAASIQAAIHIGDRAAIAAFLLDDATAFSASNPFARTSVGAQRQIWSGHAFEFRAASIASLGLSCLMRTLDELPNDEPLVQEYLQAGPYRAYVYHQGDGCRIVGSVLHAKPRVALPVIPARPRPRRRRAPTSAQIQLDFFAIPVMLGGAKGTCQGPALT